MKLKKIYLDSFKSLFKKELEIKNDCIGFVGTNESGKSNILSAINVLGGNRKLTSSDTPKMAKKFNPTLRFRFQLDQYEKEGIANIINEWISKNTTIKKEDLDLSKVEINLKVTFDKNKNEEERTYAIEGVKLDKSCLILLPENVDAQYKFYNDTSFIPLKNALIIKKAQLLTNRFDRIYQAIADRKSSLESVLKQVHELEGRLEKSSENEENYNKIEHANIGNELEKNKKKLFALNTEISSFESKVKDFNLLQLQNEVRDKLNTISTELSDEENKLSEITAKIKDFEKGETLAEAKKAELVTLEEEKASMLKAKEAKEKTLSDLKKYSDELDEPLDKKYTGDGSKINIYLIPLLKKTLTQYLPKVVFWEYSKQYIIQSETLFSELMNKRTFDDIPRPLLNIFRIGFTVNSIDELKKIINEIQDDPNERSRLQSKMKEKINEFIKGAWKDYDQDLNVTLEKDQIRIEIFDPKNEDASYYNMEERSQGCQTFLSFLLTVGAETEKGVIKNTILLLDEPETHLHPSGVRFMLEELIKISEKGNLVLYATHSIFLIDRNNFDRHIILKKEKEQTLITPANVGRIGYFMQEEVLYRTLDLDLGNEFNISKKHNFVFEGDGDAVLFEHFYDKILGKNKPFPLKEITFHQGGKCSDIEKYFSRRDLPLGSNWYFILDKDSPANKLKAFLQGRYKEFIDKNIFIFQYTKEPFEKDTELEDLLPESLLVNAYVESAKVLSIALEEKRVEGLIGENKYVDFDLAVLNDFIPKENQEFFKGRFKELLNQNIRKIVSEKKDVESFKETLNEYYEFANGIIEKIKNETPVAKT